MIDKYLEGLEVDMGLPTISAGTEDSKINWGSVGQSAATGLVAGAGAMLVVPVINALLDGYDSLVGGPVGIKSGSLLSNNVIDLSCIVTNDLSSNTVKEYCNFLSTSYALMIRSLLSSQTRSRFTQGSRSIFRDIPIHNAYDALSIDDGKFQSTASGIFGRGKYSGKAALTAFNESMMHAMDDLYLSCVAGVEADGYVTDGKGIQYVDAELTIANGMDGKASTKKLSIGVSVRPKRVSENDMFSFMVKRNKNIIEADKASQSGFSRLLGRLFNKKKEIQSTSKETGKKAEESKLYELMSKVEQIKKPFVCILISSEVHEELKEKYKIDITTSNVLQSLYKNYPIMSVGIYDSNRDKFIISITQDSPMVEYSASEITSEVSQMSKQLADIVRSKAYTSY